MNDVYIAWLLLLFVFNIVIAQYASPNWQNVALNKQCNMSSIFTDQFPNNDCSKAINGNTGTTYEDGNCIHTDVGDPIPSWTVDLGDSYTVRGIRIYPRSHGYNNQRRMGNVQVTVDNTNVYKFPADTVDSQWQTPTDIQQTTDGSSLPKTGRYVKLWKNTANAGDSLILLNVCEVQVWVCSPGCYGPNCSSCSPQCAGLPCDDITNPNSCQDVCSSSPCGNRGTCTTNAGGYTCTCVNGYTGTNCQTDINECSSNPCVRGTCNNLVGRYTCTCPNGYTGTHCETDINECSSTPCQNGGTCNDLVGYYTCTCPNGYTGTNCEIDIDECSSNPCQNGGTCRDDVNRYTCNCRNGYTGTNCETEINSCNPNPCVHGQCTDLETGYTCDCEPGYTDITCSTDIDDCVSGPCINGTCSDRVNSFACTCYVGYEGNTGEKVTDASPEAVISAGVVAGSVVGGMVLGAAIGGIAVFLVLRRRSRGAQDSPTKHRDGSKVPRGNKSGASSTAADYEDVGEHTGPRQQEEPAVEYYSSANPDQVHLSPGFPSQTAATSSSPSATAAAAESNYEEFVARGIYDRPEMYENRMEHHVYTGLKKK